MAQRTPNSTVKAVRCHCAAYVSAAPQGYTLMLQGQPICTGTMGQRRCRCRPEAEALRCYCRVAVLMQRACDAVHARNAQHMPAGRTAATAQCAAGTFSLASHVYTA